jgi:hypothetical protein
MLHATSKDIEDNYGIGARIAVLPQNPGGVTYASRTNNGEVAMITLLRERACYVVKEYELPDEDGNIIKTELLLPDSELSALKPNQAGTAVILRGAGRADTFGKNTVSAIQAFLSDRYYSFPQSFKLTIIEDDLYQSKRRIRSFSERLVPQMLNCGVMEFEDLQNVNGSLCWWLLKKPNQRTGMFGGDLSRLGGVGALLDEEIFDLRKERCADFGVIFKSVASRVAILVTIADASMDSGRSRVIMPNGKYIPWKAIGSWFAANMPSQIRMALSELSEAGESLDEITAKYLDPEWMKRLKPVSVSIPRRNGDLTTGDSKGPDLPPGDEYVESDERVNPPLHRKPYSPKRNSAGDDQSAVKRSKIVLPYVRFVAHEEMVKPNSWIYWTDSQNTIVVSRKMAPYERDIKRWMEKTGQPESTVRRAVEQGWSIELAAYVIDAKGQVRFGVSPSQIDSMLSDEALYGKTLGMQALHERIGKFITEFSQIA